MRDRLCKRTYCLWRPGEPQPDCYCLYHWTGDVPCTGQYVCMMCGEPPPSA